MNRRIRFSLALAVPLVTLTMLAAGDASAYDQYGAIAYSPDTRSHSYTYNYPSKQTAENEALLRCQSYGAGCVIAVWFRNGCGALATPNDGNGYGTGWAGSHGTAERIALNQCQASNGNCQVTRWACTSR